MGKKRRQHGTVADASEESTESEEAYHKSGKECTHFSAATDINKIRKVMAKAKWKNACVECQKSEDNGRYVEKDDEISNEPPQLWICLQCGFVACGRGQKGHAIAHYKTPRSDLHCLVIDTFQWGVWCYKCDESVNNRNAGHRKRLYEIIDVLKKWVKKNVPIQSNPHIPLCQNEISSIDNEKKKVLNDLPKVGGLANLGNTCFFNAVLQCLAQTPYLVKVLDDLQVPDQKFVLPGGKFKGADNVEIELPPIEGILEKTGSFTPVLRKTLTDMQNYDGSVYKPYELFNSLKKKQAQCTDGGQHDSHELLRHLLELVRTEDVKRYQKVILKEVGLSEKTKPQFVDDNLRSRVKFYGNQANAKYLGPESVFRGELVSTLECLECHHSSTRTEPFLDLSLPVLVEKALPSNLKRKNNSFDNSFDSMGNNISNTHSKSEMKETHKRRSRSFRETKITYPDFNLTFRNTNRISEEKKGTAAESEESDADVEDNIENEEASIPEIGESGYSSEKPSAVTSPVSLAEFQSTDSNTNNVDLNVSPIENDISYNFDEFPHRNNTNLNSSQSPTDNHIRELTENMKNGTVGLSLSTSLVVHSDFTSPEGPTISPLSSPPTSKNSPTSTISSAVDGEEIEKRLDNSTEKHCSSDKEDSCKKTITSNDVAEESSSIEKVEKENHTTKKLTNGVGDIMSNMTKLKLSSPSGSPTRYPTKEGECSIQLCLNQFTALEIMNGNNKVGCIACTKREYKGKTEGVKMVCTDSTKQYLISKVPAILILHLKRFQVEKFSFRKVGKHVSFPMLLDLAPVSNDYSKPRIYALYGVVEHSGTLYGGHYVAYVKSRAPLKPDDPRWAFLPKNDSSENADTSTESTSESLNEDTSGAKTPQVEPPPGRWYYVSDSRVREIDEKSVLNSQAYLLFYERIL